MEFIGPQCAARSLGPANYLVTSLISTLVAIHCNISTPEMWPPDHGEEAVKNGFDRYDFIVAGAGTAGSVVASRLAENPDYRVLLLEAGHDPPMESEIPGLAFTTHNKDYDWQYKTTTNSLSCLASEAESCVWSKGKVLGGSGAINGMLYLRGNPRDYDSWEEEGNPTWGWRDIWPYIKKSENFKGDNRYDAHGTKGPINVEAFKSSKHDQYIILEASAELGYQQVDDFVNGQNLGFGFVYGTLKDGRRMSSAKAFLTNAPPNLHVVRNAYMEKVEFDSELKVKSVKVWINGTHELDVEVTKEVILSAGAIESPKVLMLSGIGLDTHLRAMSIKPIKDSPVGDNLMEHSSVALFLKYKKNKELYSNREKELYDSVFSQWMHRDGPFGNGALDIVGFISTKKSTRYPDIMYRFTPIANSSLARGYKSNVQNSIDKQVTDENQLVRVDVMLLNPRSRGHIRLESVDFRKPPIIIPNNFQKDSDMKTMLRGIKELFAFERTKSFERVHARFLRLDLPACDQAPYKGRKYLECYANHMTSSSYDDAGTCKMGPAKDHTAVVDSELRVRGVTGLRVVDASIMPSMISGSLNAATVMIAEKGADLIKDTWKQL